MKILKITDPVQIQTLQPPLPKGNCVIDNIMRKRLRLRKTLLRKIVQVISLSFVMEENLENS